jgi:hypothetical protein
MYEWYNFKLQLISDNSRVLGKLIEFPGIFWIPFLAHSKRFLKFRGFDLPFWEGFLREMVFC